MNASCRNPVYWLQFFDECDAVHFDVAGRSYKLNYVRSFALETGQRITMHEFGMIDGSIHYSDGRKLPDGIFVTLTEFPRHGPDGGQGVRVFVRMDEKGGWGAVGRALLTISPECEN